MSIHSERHKRTDEETLEIYRRVLEKKRLYNVPYKESLRIYGIASWSSFNVKVKILLDKKK